MSRLSPKHPVAHTSVRRSLLRRAAVSVAALGLTVSGAMTLPLWANVRVATGPEKLPPPSQIVAEAPASEWVIIAPSDLVVMQLAPDAKGRERRVVIQLMPAPFSQGWVGNIRKLVAARWYDGVSVNRVQDNYVVQWGDANGEDAGQAKALPEGLVNVGEGDYVTDITKKRFPLFGDGPVSRLFLSTLMPILRTGDKVLDLLNSRLVSTTLTSVTRLSLLECP